VPYLVRTGSGGNGRFWFGRKVFNKGKKQVLDKKTPKHLKIGKKGKTFKINI